MRISQTHQFKKDIKKQIRKGKEPEKLSRLLKYLQARATIPNRYKDHPLRGNWKGRRDAHIEPDWILIYRIFDDEIRLERTGSHADLF